MRGKTLLAIMAFILCSAVCFAPSAHAAQLVELGQFGGQKGGGAGEIAEGSGIAVNATGVGGVEAGRIYVADTGNARVDVFSKEGAFVAAWGKDVDATDPGTGFEICAAASGDSCQAGTESGEAGAFRAPRGIAVDPRTGNVYVDGNNNLRVDVFSPAGKFEGAFGRAVDATAPAAEFQFCTAATGCQIGELSAAAGGFVAIYNGAIGIDPTSGDVWVGDLETHRLNQFSVEENGQAEVVGASFVRGVGWNVNAAAPAEEFQRCTGATGCKEGTPGSGAGQINDPVSIAFGNGRELYVSTVGSGCTPTEPCRVLRFKSDGTPAGTFGPSSGGTQKCQVNLEDERSATSNSATSLAVRPADQHVFVTLKTAEAAYEICEFDSSGTLLQRSPAEPVVSPAQARYPSLGLALGPEGRVDVQAPNEAGTAYPVKIFGLVPAAPAEVLPVTELTSDSAVLNGEITTPEPGGRGFDVRYRFEYSDDGGATWLRAPDVGTANVGSTAPGPHEVHQRVSGLLANATYLVRLATFTSYPGVSAVQSFRTPKGPPGIRAVRATDASQTDVTLEAEIDPNGSTSNYRLEWGETNGYGHVAPVEYEPTLGAGHEGVPVRVHLEGLAAASTYHYRFVARSGGGATFSPDQIFETLNSCGLPEGRCYELVSRRDSGPVSVPGEKNTAVELDYQAATSGAGGLAYIVESGYQDATKGSEVLYHGLRGPAEWTSTQLSTSLTTRNERPGANSSNPAVGWLSDDLSCGLQQSYQPLTPDPRGEVVREYGGPNLYRINSDNSRTLVTSIPPENPGPEIAYAMAEGSQDCSKLVFGTAFRYPGIPGTGLYQLYEWEEGQLRNAGYVPGPNGEEVAVEATPAPTTSVSDDGSRVFFTAVRQTSANPKEIGQTGIFVREDGNRTRDLSKSETQTPQVDLPSSGRGGFQWTTPDGSKLFFLANAGLTENSNSEGVDLYEYDLEAEKLEDLSVAPDSGRADVLGFVSATPDGSRVFFAAREQLVPGRGRSSLENIAQNSYSIYGEEDGKIRYVGNFDTNEIGQSLKAHVTVGEGSAYEWTSQVTPDGRYLLFESDLDNTPYDSESRLMAYLYDWDEGAEGSTICVSCRQDGEPTVTELPFFGYSPIPSGVSLNAFNRQSRFLAYRDGRPSVFFVSPDALAPGAIERQNNVYEWSHGQVFRLTSALPGQAVQPSSGIFAFPVGTTDDGSDAYFVSPSRLNWEDGDDRTSVYDARIGGGYPEPPAPPAPCQTAVEGSCQGPAQPGPQAPGAASESFTGPGTPPAKHKKKPKKHRKKKPHRRHKGHRRKAHGRGKAGKKHQSGNRKGSR